MNGENFEAAALCACASRAAAEGCAFAFEPLPDAGAMIFRFLPRGGEDLIAKTPAEWHAACLALGAKEFGCRLPLAAADREPPCVRVIFPEGRESVFSAKWFRGSRPGLWSVAFQERRADAQGRAEPVSGSRALLASELSASAALAAELGLASYEGCFLRARAVLEGNLPFARKAGWPAMEGDAASLFAAAFLCDVFDSEGRWSEESQRIASRLGLLGRYDEAAARLFRASRLAAMEAAGSASDERPEKPSSRPSSALAGLLARLRRR